MRTRVVAARAPNCNGFLANRHLALALRELICSNRRALKTFLSCIALLFVVAGCATAPTPTPIGPFKIKTGQVLYASPKTTIVGNFIAKVSPSDFMFDLSKGPGASLISVRSHGKDFVSIVAQGRHWQGNPRFAPKIVKTWAALRCAFDNAPAPEGCTIQRNGRIVTVEFPASRERFVFHIDR